MLAEHKRGEQHDGDRLEGPQQDRHAGGDRGQPDQAERVRDPGVEDAERGEPAHRRCPGERLAADQGDDEQEDAAGGQLHRKQGEGCDVVDDLLGRDGAGPPAGRCGDQGGDRGRPVGARGRSASGMAELRWKKWAGLNVGAAGRRQRRQFAASSPSQQS